MMNGPVEGIGEGCGPSLSEERPWDRAWTLDEMQKGADHWSLASDAGMLHYLQEFSQKMISRTHDIQEQMNGLIHEAKLTGVRLDNTVNDFIMLANTQFVENRVYEEDISQVETATAESKKKKQDLTKEERSAALIPRIKDAMAFGLEVLDVAFEKIDVTETNSDSEDDDTAYVTEAILEPKDPYLSRPLPHLIGSPAFLHSDDIGLVEEASDDDVSDHGSISESESAASSSEEEETQKVNGDTGRDRHVSTSSSSEVESQSSGDLFGGKESASDEDKMPSKGEKKTDVIETQKTKADDFASELASRIRSSPPPMNKEPKKKKRSNHKDDVFAPPSLSSDEDEDDDSPFSRKSGLFSSGGGLFDDNQEEDGLYDNGPSTVDRDMGGPLGQDLGPGRDVGKKEDTLEVKKEGRKERVMSTTKKTPTGGLFDDVQDDDDLFAALTPKKPSAKPVAEVTATVKPKSGLFGDDDEEGDMFAVKEQKAASSKKKLPAGAVSMFGAAQNPLVAAIKAQKPPHSDTDDSDEGNQSNVSSVSTASVTRDSQKKNRSPSVSSNSLFAEEPEDLFFVPQGKTAAKGHSVAGGGGLFSDDEDLFGSSNKPEVAAASGARKSGLLFDVEDNDDGDFLSGVTVKSSATAKKLPDNDEGVEKGGDLFGSTRKIEAQKQKPAEVKGQSSVTPRKTTLSLFDDGDDDDLFAATPKSGTMSSTGQSTMDSASRASNKALLHDDDWLFGGEDDTDPTIDLFDTKKPTKTKGLQNKTSPPVATEDTISRASDRNEIAPSAMEGKKTVQEDEPDAILVKPKKLAGAVSMFGGIDPAMVGRTRSGSRPPITEKPARQKQEEVNFVDQIDKQFTKSSSEGVTVKPDAFGPPFVKSNVEALVGKCQTSPDIRTKQANLTLDPSALLPRASGPRNSVETGRILEGAASFDEPVQIPVLHSVSKDRARVQVKRRPPTRKSRLTVNNSQDALDATGVIDRGLDPSHAPSVPPTNDNLFSPRKGNKLTTSTIAQKKHLFSDDPDELLATAENVIIHNSEILDGGLSDSSDIVTGSSVTTLRHSTSKTTATEGLFDDNDITHPQGSKIGRSERSTVDQLPHDLTAENTNSSEDEQLPTSNRGDVTKSKVRRMPDLFADNENIDDILGIDKNVTVASAVTLPENDDIFGSSFTNKSKSQTGSWLVSTSMASVTPPEDDDINNIFAVSAVNAKKGRKTPDKQVTQRTVPSDDEDDIFGPLTRPVHHQPRKAVTRDEDIFADDTDIFADLPSSKSKKMKAKTSSGQTKSLFASDDVDDIFADVPPKPQSKMKKTPTSVKNAAASKGASIFDSDSPSIFDDPLNALGK